LALENIGYIKEVNKNYVDEAKMGNSRFFSFIESTDEAFRSTLDKSLNTMSWCILSYKGPSALTSEDKLLHIDPSNKSKHKDLPLEYLKRSRRKAADILNVDPKRLMNESYYPSMYKDSYLLELKGK
jgi:hypothetical protein